MTDDDDAPPKPDNRMLAVALALAAAACLVYASFTPHWLVNAGQFEEISFGVRSVDQCRAESACGTVSNHAFIDDLRAAGLPDQASNAFWSMGWATFVECMLSAAGLVAAAAIALARKHPQLPMAPTTLALLGIMAALITGCVFVATKPGPPGFVGVGMSFWVFGGGAVMGIAGAQLLAKVNRPPDPDLMEDAMNPDQF